MKKSAGIVVGAVVAVAAIGVGGAWYTGNQLPSVLDESIKQANADLKARPAADYADACVVLLSSAGAAWRGAIRDACAR